MSVCTRQALWRRFIAPMVWIAIVQVFVSSLMASSHELHEFFHSDAHDSGHHCLSTDFQSGAIDQPLLVQVVLPEIEFVEDGSVTFSAEIRHFLPLHLCGSLLVHGPPALA